ncbi:MAG: PHP domain-containing protein [Acidimicrobiia bacterium]|nr:PHP domain-containing protein [Acidimicrobiia bacterium]
MAVDLHTHSTMSDGSFTPSELVVEAADIGLSAMALTDHDTLDGVAEAAKAAATVELRLIPGV